MHCTINHIPLLEHSMTQFMVSRAEDNGLALYEFIKTLALPKSIEQKLLRYLLGFGYDAFALYVHQQRPKLLTEQKVFEQLRVFINKLELPHFFDNNQNIPQGA